MQCIMPQGFLKTRVVRKLCVKSKELKRDSSQSIKHEKGCEKMTEYDKLL